MESFFKMKCPLQKNHHDILKYHGFVIVVIYIYNHIFSIDPPHNLRQKKTFQNVKHKILKSINELN